MSETNGLDDSLLPPWLPSAEAMAFLGVSSQKLTKLAQSNSIVRKFDGGAWAYERASLASYLETSSGDNDDKLTANNSELVALLKVSVRHTEDSFKMVHGPANSLLGHYQEELKRARERIQHLESAHDEAVKAREAALTEQHQRELETRMAERRAERWDAAFAVLKETGPALLFQIVETLSDARDPKKLAAVRLMARLTPDRIASLLEAEALDPEERTLLQETLRAHAEREAKAAEAKQAEAAKQAESAPSAEPAPKAKRSRAPRSKP